MPDPIAFYRNFESEVSGFRATMYTDRIPEHEKSRHFFLWYGNVMVTILHNNTFPGDVAVFVGNTLHTLESFKQEILYNNNTFATSGVVHSTHIDDNFLTSAQKLGVMQFAQQLHFTAKNVLTPGDGNGKIPMTFYVIGDVPFYAGIGDCTSFFILNETLLTFSQLETYVLYALD